MKGLLRCLREMSPAAYSMVLGTLQVCCVMLLCAFMLLVHSETAGPEAQSLRQGALELCRNSLGILLLGVIFSPILEERSRR